MAEETMERIRQAEMEAADLLKNARAEAEKIIEDANREAASREKKAESDARELLLSVNREAEAISREEAEAVGVAGSEERKEMEDAVSGKRDEAVRLVLDHLF